MEPFEILEEGIFHTTGLPRHGRQDLGYSPGGAQDRFSLETGNIMLDNDTQMPALEILLPPRLRFTEDYCFVLTGGGFDGVCLVSREGSRPVTHAQVYLARAGSELHFGQRKYGFRTYLCYRRASGNAGRVVGRKRGDFGDVCRWPDREGRIRVLAGPEYRYVERRELFFASSWRVASEASDMGMRLGRDGEMPHAALEDMISAPVEDGTVQLTPDGPIVLLRQRQTVGGYPRALNVVSADVDLLAQYAPFQRIDFRLISIGEAWKIARTRKADLERIRNRFHGRQR